jgi:hypothetical protein
MQGEAVLSGGCAMDDLKKSGAQDRESISLSEAWEIDYWTSELGVSKGELKRIIARVGNSAAAVRKELGKPR